MLCVENVLVELLAAVEVLGVDVVVGYAVNRVGVRYGGGGVLSLAAIPAVAANVSRTAVKNAKNFLLLKI
ncbi:MAG: hypothetical protein II869_02775 [Synergistaceae bacterium]|nr:hypothetical protein [Synergistaceae bacterium]